MTRLAVTVDPVDGKAQVNARIWTAVDVHSLTPNE
jgi:hypothetical protein